MLNKILPGDLALVPSTSFLYQDKDLYTAPNNTLSDVIERNSMLVIIGVVNNSIYDIDIDKQTFGWTHINCVIKVYE